MSIMLTLSCFREGDDSSQLQGTVFLKTEPTHTVQQMTDAFCRWSGLPPAQCMLVFNNERLAPTTKVGETSLKSSSPIIAYIASNAPEPNATAKCAPFTVVDVTDSELSGLLGGGL